MEIDFIEYESRCLGISFGEIINAGWQRQRVASTYRPETQGSWAGMGNISGNAPDSLFPDE